MPRWATKKRDVRTAVIDAMTTNETLWFRDKYPFELLTKRLFPEMLEKKKNIKIWSSASSSGQEAYSIAMTALEYKRLKSALGLNVQIVGTDISNTMLAQCKEGIYDQLALSRDLPPEHKRVYFDDLKDDTNKMQVKAEVKRLTTFKNYNLLDSYGAQGKFY
ncbi:MAG TPA: chemotaxis protein CheR, partial [Psychromonas hadalis]|nr:chemotaxis protein CheR [Psychromonas hadalis]